MAWVYMSTYLTEQYLVHLLTGANGGGHLRRLYTDAGAAFKNLHAHPAGSINTCYVSFVMWIVTVLLN